MMDNCVVNAVALDADGYTHNYRSRKHHRRPSYDEAGDRHRMYASGLICAFVAADCDDKYGAVTAALSCMKSAGGLAASDGRARQRQTAVISLSPEMLHTGTG